RRSQLYLKIWERLSLKVPQEQQMIMGQLREWAGTTATARKNYFRMSQDHILALASKDLFTLGGHTVSHPALAYHGKEFQKKEINMNKFFLENLCGEKINLFAYPSGSYNDTTIEVLRE